MSVRKTYLAILSIFAIRRRIHPPEHGRSKRIPDAETNLHVQLGVSFRETLFLLCIMALINPFPYRHRFGQIVLNVPKAHLCAFREIVTNCYNWILTAYIFTTGQRFFQTKHYARKKISYGKVREQKSCRNIAETMLNEQ
jgi:hypothetical protein